MLEYDFTLMLPDDEQVNCKAFLIENSIDPDDWEVYSFSIEVYSDYLEHYVWIEVEPDEPKYAEIKLTFEKIDEFYIDYEWDRRDKS